MVFGVTCPGLFEEGSSAGIIPAERRESLVSRSSRRAYRTSRSLHTLALVASLSITNGCAKLHHKLHKHKHAGEELACVPFPARSSHAGLASVSPQMPTMVNSTVSKQEPVANPASSVIVQAPAAVSQFPTMIEAPAAPIATSPPRSGATSYDDASPPATPAPVTIRPTTPAIAAPAAVAPEPAAPARTENKTANQSSTEPSTPATSKPAQEADTKLPAPPEPPSLDKLPIELPKELPPPAGPNPFQTSAPAVRISGPNAAANAQPTAPLLAPADKANDSSGRVITLSQPGEPAQPEPASTAGSVVDTNSAPAAKPVASGAASAVAELGSILAKSRQTFANVSNYKVDVQLQERMNGRLLPQDKFTLFKRREPLAVRMEWTEGKDVGREVIYSPVETKGMIQIRMPKGLIPRMSMSPDSPLVRSKSRHPINDAGVDSVLERLVATHEQFRSGNPQAGQLQVEQSSDPQLGTVRRITHRTHDREIWVVDLDEKTGVPLTIHATDESGELLEHYEFRGYQFNLPELLTVAAFDHNARWGSQKLLGRLATGNTKDAETKR